MKLITIVGARPQFIKAASISEKLIKYNTEVTELFEEVILNTGQHFDRGMSDVFFDELKIPQPRYNLHISGGTHAGMTGRMLIEIEDVLIKEKPDAVIVYGDTNSTLAGALASVKLQIPIVHIEAGLRSYDPRMPEEINRVTTDAIASVLFCPTTNSIENLKKENIYTGNLTNQKVYYSGDIMYDSFLMLSGYKNEAIIEKIGITPDEYILCTLHRASNTDTKTALSDAIRNIEYISREVGMKVLLPIHPRTKNKLLEFGIDISDRIIVIEPLSYLDMNTLLHNCRFVMTDSGGLQKEAFWARKPCITMRETTEWIEAVDNGFNILIGTDITKVEKSIGSISNISFDNDAYRKLCKEYGDGQAAKRIVETLATII